MSIGELQNTKNKQKQIIETLTEQLEEEQQNNSKMEIIIKENNKKIEELLNSQKILKEEAQKKIEEGELTESDLKILKDEVEKVNNAYLETEAQLETAKQELRQAYDEKEWLMKEKIKLGRKIEELEGQQMAARTKQQALELSERDMRDEYYHKTQ